MRVMRKPYKTPTSGGTGLKTLTMHSLCENGKGPLPGSKIRKRVYRETI